MIAYFFVCSCHRNNSRPAKKDKKDKVRNKYGFIFCILLHQQVLFKFPILKEICDKLLQISRDIGAIHHLLVIVKTWKQIVFIPWHQEKECPHIPDIVLLYSFIIPDIVLTNHLELADLSVQGKCVKDHWTWIEALNLGNSGTQIAHK